MAQKKLLQVQKVMMEQLVSGLCRKKDDVDFSREGIYIWRHGQGFCDDIIQALVLNNVTKRKKVFSKYSWRH